MSTKATADTSATVTKPAEKPPALEYRMDAGGKITRTDKDSSVHVATLIDGGKLVLVPQWSKFRPAVVRWLNDQDLTPKSIVMEGDEDRTPKENIPPMPKKEMRLGDKTPAVVEWYRKYKPAEYKARYGIKGEGTVTKYRTVINPNTGIPEKQAYQVDCVLAERKIEGTEKMEANETTLGQDSEYSDAK